MKISCILLLLIPQFVVAQISISEARKTKTGKIISVTGRVTVSGEFGELTFIQDSTGGIAVYGTTMPPEGDSVQVTGELVKYNGMLEILSDTARILATGGSPMTPKVISIKKLKDHEGELVQLNNVRIGPAGHFFYPQREGMMIVNGDTAQYWIDEHTDIPGYNVPPATTNIVGIVGRFGNKLQILPRKHTDIGNTTIPRTEPGRYFTILNWNLEFFGASRKKYGSEFGPPNEAQQVSNVARVLNETKPDLAALQEVSDDQSFKDLVKLLPGYEGRCSNRYSYFFEPSNDFPPQKLCFVYNSSTVKFVREKILFRKLFDQSPSDIFSTGRLPYLIEVNAMGRSLTIVNIHAKSGSTPNDRYRRQTDAQMLKDTLDAYYPDRELMILGDFNDDVDISIASGLASPYESFLDDNRYECISSVLSHDRWPSTISYDDMIDHQLVSSAMKACYVDGSIRVVNPFGSISLYGRSTSDHLPVQSEYDLGLVSFAADTNLTGAAPRIYPNPTNDLLWIESDEEATIIDALGVVLMKTKGAQSPISLGDYAPGIYTVMFGNTTVRIIKN